jgi:alpha-beta hydrolase superfamily lysophospholipase
MANDIHVVIHNHRGHGKNSENLGHFDRFDDLITDALAVKSLIPGSLRTFVLGHSMGSIVARRLLSTHEYDAGIIVGTGNKDGILDGPLSQFMNAARRIRPRMKGELLTNIAFFGYDKHFPETLENRWLCSDMEVVQSYNEDEYCGQHMTFNALAEIVRSIRLTNSNNVLGKYQTGIPILLIGGKEDPFSDFGQDIRALAKNLIRYTDSVTVQLYDKSRHEVLNEKNREQVYQKLLEWVMLRVD